MRRKDTRLVKGLSATVAGVRSLTCVFPPVNLQLGFVRESLTAVCALVRLVSVATVHRALFFLPVHSLVRVKISRLGERLSASATTVRPLHGMALMREDFPAVTALVLNV